MNVSPVLVTELLEKPRMLEQQESLGKETEAERSKTGTHESLFTLLYTNSLCGFRTATDTTKIGK